MKNSFLSLCPAGVATAFLLATGSGHAQGADTLLEAAGSVGRYLGPQALSAIISIEGGRGTPQPTGWEFRVADAAAPNGVQLVTANAARAIRRTAPGDGYPMAIPPAFFAWQSVQTDSQAAFQIGNGEATKAMISFDYVHYLLRARDGTTKPVWLLTLFDVENRPVGRLEISAKSGAVERRVWMRYEGPGRRELLRIEDSASPLLALQPPQVAPPPATGGPDPLPVPPPASSPPAPVAPPPADGAYTPLPPQR